MQTWQKIRCTLRFTITNIDLHMANKSEFILKWTKKNDKGMTNSISPNNEHKLVFNATFESEIAMFINKTNGLVRPKKIDFKLKRVIDPETQKVYGKDTVDVSQFWNKEKKNIYIHDMESGHSVAPTITIIFEIIPTEEKSPDSNNLKNDSEESESDDSISDHMSTPSPSKPSNKNDTASLTSKISDTVEQLDSKDKEIHDQKVMYEKQIEMKNKEIHDQKAMFEKQIEMKNKEIHDQKVMFEKQIEMKNKEIHDQKAMFEKQIEMKDKELESIKKEIEELKQKYLHNQNDESQNKQITIFDSETIKNLEKIEEINSGSYGKVYKVAKKTIYALKVLNKKVVHKEFQQFLSEYEIMNILDHPNILKTFGIFLSDEEQPPSILLEYCPMNIEESIKSLHEKKVDLVFSIYQIAEAMKYIHFRKIIHRDLKPSNILITNDGIIKIGDFGVSKLMSSEEQSMTSGVGTQKFMAPEIIDESDIYDEKVDVYSFGVLLFFMLSGGELPKIKMSDKMKGKKAEIPSNFTQFSIKLINDCWEFDSKDRPSFTEIVNEMENNNYTLVQLSKSEFDEINIKIKKHKENIPNYS